ncbi:MAG: exopolysaccharide biosynthesis polyprenyl glycosylphosphotransferase [Candidatus Muiribacteriota bacterium]
MKFLIIFVDIIYYLSSGYFLISTLFFPENIEAFYNIILFFIGYKVFFNYFFDLYEFSIHEDKTYIFFKAFQASVVSTLTVVFTTFYLRYFALPRSFIGITAFLDVIYLFITRIFLWRKKIKHTGIVTGSIDRFNFLKKELRLYNNNLNIFQIKDNYKNLKNKIKNREVDQIILLSDEKSKDFKEVVRLLWYAKINKVDLMLYPTLADSFKSKIIFSDISGLPFINLTNSRIKLWEKLFKRLFDISISIFILIILFLFLPFIAFVIKYDSSGRVFYLQERIGKKGKKFKLIKFRTMYEDAEEKTGPKLAEKNDKRITKTGYFLRKYKIDELPQFFNVLKGDMSIVGPRPEREFFVKKNFMKLPGYFIRTSVKPGITGMAQVFGGYYTEPEEKLKFDFIYINNYSFIVDFRIIILTFFNILS